MKKTPLIVAFLVLSAALAVLVPVQAEAPTGWTEEIPGVPLGVTEVVMNGGASTGGDKVGIVYVTVDGMGFVVRNPSTGWDVKTDDITGNATTLSDPSLCYNDDQEWVIAAYTGSNITVYETLDDGMTWDLKLWLASSNWLGEIDCFDSDLWGLVTIDGGNLLFYKTSNGGDSWSDPKDIDEGLANLEGAALAWGSSSEVLVIFGQSPTGNPRTGLTKSDDAGAFWIAPVIIDSGSNAFFDHQGVGIQSLGNELYVAANNLGVGGETYTAWWVGTYNNLGAKRILPDNPDSQSNNDYYCGDEACQIAINSEGQALITQERPTIASAYFVEAGGTTATRVESSPSDAGRDFSAWIGDEIAVFAYRDTAQGNRVEARVATVVPPAGSFTYVNPNGNNWGDVRANWDSTDREIYLKERAATDDATLGNIYRMETDLTKITQWDACPEVRFDNAFKFASTKDETLSTPGNLGVVPAIQTEVYAACLGDFATSNEFYYLAQFDRFGSFQGYIPINAVTAIDNPAFLEPCADNLVWTEHFSQVDPVNITLVDTADSEPIQGTHQSDQGKIFDVIAADLTAIATDPLAFNAAPAGFTECRFYHLSSTDGLRALNEDGIEWQTPSATGAGLAAYNGQVWVTNNAGTMVSRYIDLGTSFSLAETEAMTTDLNSFNEQLRVSKDGAYLIAHCDTNDVCIYSATDYTLIYTATIPAGGVMFYDMDILNEFLYVTRDDTAYAFQISSVTSAFGDPDNCLVEPLPDACEQVTTTTTTTTTGIGPSGVGGEEGGFIGEPGSGIGLDLEGVADQTGFSVGALAWILGILFVTAITVGMGSLTLVERRGGMGGSFSVPLAFVGFVLGVGGATAMSFLPVWFVVVLGVLGAGALVLRTRSGAGS